MRPRRLAARRHSAIALCLAVSTAAGAAAAAPRWSYSGADGPDRWAAISNAFATCGSGHQQSPIDLNAAVSRDLANPQVAYQPSDATIVDNGHAVEVDLGRAGNILTVDGVPYALVQLHFHSPSEHTIDGNSFAIELHLVHQADGGALAVVGVFIAGGAENPALVPVLSAMPSKENREVRLRAPFDPSTLLPEDRRAYRYTGSLTTPPCTEGVVWNVMRRTMSDGRHHLEQFGEHFSHNAREVQPRNERKVQ